MSNIVDKSIGKSRPVTIGGKTYVIKKMHVGKYAMLLSEMNNLPSKLMEICPDMNFDEVKEKLGNMSSEDMLRYLPKLMQFAANEVIGIVSFVSNIPKEVFEYRDDIPDEEIVGLDEMLDVIDIVIEINNFGKVSEQIKNLMTPR